MTTKTDSFPTTMNPLSGHWATLNGGLKCTGAGVVVGSGPSPQDNTSIWSTSDYTFLADHTAQITFTAAGNFDWAGPLVRGSGSGATATGYIAYIRPESSGISVFKLTAGTVGVGSGFIVNYSGLTLTGTHTLQLGVAGTTLTTILDSTTLGTITDATYATGQPGMAYEDGNNNVTHITSFTATDAASAGPSIAVLTANYYRRRRLM
jgi:hypothetical protein